MYNIIKSFWQNDYYFPSYDVVIIGGGFTGLTAGIELLLSKPKLKVGLFESETHGTLASSRNAGFMCFGSPTELLADIQQHGESAIQNLMTLKTLGYSTLLKHLHGNRRIYNKVRGYELFSQSQVHTQYQAVVEQLPMLNHILKNGTGISNYFTEDQSPSASTRWKCIKFQHEGQVHPTAAVAALTKKFLNLGGRYHAGTSISSWEKQNTGFSLEAEGVPKINTQSLMVATNAFASKLLPDYFVQPQRAQVLVTAPLQRLPFKGNFHMNEGFVYFRNIQNRLLLGGLRNTDFEIEATAELGLNDRIQANLDQLLQSLIPGEKVEITHRWTGIMGFRNGKTPEVVMHPSGVVVAAGMNGMGTLLGPALGKLAASALLKK